MFIPNIKKKHYIGIFLFVGYPIIAFFLLSGNESLGLEYVSTHKWGGLSLTFLLGSICIVFALPLGIILAFTSKGISLYLARSTTIKVGYDVTKDLYLPLDDLTREQIYNKFLSYKKTFF